MEFLKDTNYKYLLLPAALVIAIVSIGLVSLNKTELSVGGDNVLPIAGQTYYLAGSGLGSSDTSVTLTSFSIPQNGLKITDAMMSETFYLTIEPGSRTRQEIASCTTVTQNADGTATLSGCTRGLSPVSPYTASSTLKFAHSGGASVIFSNPPQLYNQTTFKDNDETITGSWLFPTPLAGSNAATKDYVDSVVNGGTISYDSTIVAGNAGETVATGTLVYFKGTDQEWYKVDIDDSTTYQDKFIGLTQGAGTNGVAITDGILLKGRDTTQTGLTPGSTYYASTSAGTIHTTSSVQPIGIAEDTNILYFDPVLIDVPRLTRHNTFTATTSFSGSTDGVGYVEVYTGTSSSLTWTKLSNAKVVEVYAIGGGGGGASGARGANVDGGAGGGGGGFSHHTFNASTLSATTSISVGAGGAGGAARTTDGTQNAGTNGGDSSFGNYLIAKGGTAGSLITGGAGGYGTYQGSDGGNGADSGTSVATAGSDSNYEAPTGGGGGGGSQASYRTGADGGDKLTISQTGGSGGAAGVAGSISATTFENETIGGVGGGGGGGSDSAAGGTGARGVIYGSGGGGGGGAQGFNSGAGGNGADGIVIVITY